MADKIIDPFVNIPYAELPTATPQDAGGTYLSDLRTINAGSGNDVFRMDSQGIWLGSAKFVDAPFSVSMQGDITATSLSLTGGTFSYGKTSFSDNVHAGYFLSNLGFYIGAAGDTTKLLYTLADGTFVFVGAHSGGSIAGIPIAQVGYASTDVADIVPLNLAVASTGVTAGADGGSDAFISLTWTAIASNTFDHYLIRYKKTAFSAYNYIIASTNAIVLDGLTPNMEYKIGIASVNKYGTQSAFSTDITQTTAKDTTPPATVAGVAATGGIQYIVVEWAASAESDLSYYNVYRSLTNNSAAAVLIRSSKSNYFVDGNRTAGTPYYYFIKAMDTSGNESTAFSTVATATAHNANAADVNISNRGWTQTCVFSVVDTDTVAWAAGVFTAADGTSYNIGAGNTGNMSARTFIYLDIAVSTTAYQTTTTAATAVGDGKVLIGVAQNNTTEAIFEVFGGIGGANWKGGDIVTGSITSGELGAGCVTSSKSSLGMRGWTQTSVFTVTDADTVAWGAGTFTASDGTAYSIGAGNTGNMAAKTYIYLDIDVSTTAYQTTTNAATAIGDGKVLVAIAQNGTAEASFFLLNNNSYNIDAANIVAGSITANEIAASTITGAKIAATTIEAGNIKANTITASQIAAATITSNEIAANTIVAGNIAAGTITATQIATATITGAQIANGTIASANILSLAADKVLINGAVYLSNWQKSGDLTKIDGGAISANTITTTQLNFTPVQGSNVIAAINASAEGITIDADNIAISGSTSFASGYNPNTALLLAQTKRRVFTAEPVTPYEVGDLWTTGTILKTCTTQRLTGTYNAADWGLATGYTDDTVANSKVKTFIQDAIPTSISAGDLWIDSDGGNQLYRATAVGDTTIAAGHWVAVPDQNKLGGTGSSAVGGAYSTALSGARVLIFPSATIGIQVIDDAAADVLKVMVGGTDVGDVIIGNFAGGQGIKYDKSLNTTTFAGTLSAAAGTLGTITAGTLTGVAITSSTITAGIIQTAANGNNRIEMKSVDSTTNIFWKDTGNINRAWCAFDFATSMFHIYVYDGVSSSSDFVFAQNGAYPKFYPATTGVLGDDTHRWYLWADGIVNYGALNFHDQTIGTGTLTCGKYFTVQVQGTTYKVPCVAA